VKGGKRPVTKLVEAGLFIPADGGFCIKDYLDWNPTRERVLAERDRERGKKSRQRGVSPGVSRGVSPGDNLGESPGMARMSPGESGVCPDAPTPTTHNGSR
jgi:hypothetical protein